MKKVKIVYEDNGISKVLKGHIIKEDEYTYTIQTDINIVIVGKRSLISIVEVLQ